MGRSESAESSIGYRVMVRDLVESIVDNSSYMYVYNTLMDEDVFIEDANDELNHAFYDIVYDMDIDETTSYDVAKPYLMNKYKKLLEDDLLIPMIRLTQTMRWGYNREGANGAGEALGDDLVERIQQLYKDCPPHHSVVTIIKQM